MGSETVPPDGKPHKQSISRLKFAFGKPDGPFTQRNSSRFIWDVLGFAKRSTKQ